MAKISRQFVTETDADLSGNVTTPAINVAQDDGYCIETVFTGLGGTSSGTATLQVSIGGDAFADYISSTQNITATTVSLVWEVSPKRHKFARIKIVPVNCAGATATTTYAGEAFVE